MPSALPGIIWAVIAIIVVLLMLTSGIITSIIIHSRKIKESEGRFSHLFDSVIDANILIDKNSQILDVNKSACNLLGYPRDDFLRFSLEELVPERKWSKFQKVIETAFKRDINVRGESELVCNNGSPIQMEFGGTCITIQNTSYFLGSFRDITDPKRAEEALKESEERYRAVCEYSPVGICLTDKDGIYHYVNPAYCKIYGYTEEEFIGRPYFEILMNSGNPEARRQRYNQLFEDGKVIEVGETKFLKKGGESIWIQYTGDFVRQDNKPKFMVSINIDITEQKRIWQTLSEERQILQEKNIALKEVLSHLEEEKLKIREEFADSINRLLMPTLHNLINEDGTVNTAYYNLLENNLKELVAFNIGIRQAFSNLSPREIEICNLIKSGATSKKISRTLNLSLLTINKHRQRIRSKLTICNKNINLTSYLRDHG